MSILKKSATYARIASVFAFKLIIPFLFGILLNWIFVFFFSGKWLGDVSWFTSLPTLLVMALFLIGFPGLYFLLGQKHATKKGLAILYKGSHPLVSKVVGSVVTKAVNSSEKATNSTIFNKKGVKKAGSFVKGLSEKTPRSVRWIVEFVLAQTPIQSFLVETSKEVELKSDNLGAVIPIVQKKVDTFVEEELIGVGLMGFWVLLLSNIGVMVLTWWLV